MSPNSAMDRAMGALLGVAIGDAMGMPSQTMTREAIHDAYGRISDFVDAAPGQPVSRGLKAGTITDDMEQTLLLARHLIDRRGKMDERVWAEALLAWERETHARGVNDLLGPSTKRAIDALQRGVPADEVGRFGTTNGAAMRIVPVGILMPAEPLSRFVNSVFETCRLTHNTSEAIGAAAAVAAVVSAGVDGASFEDALPLAVRAAQEGERLGAPAQSVSISRQIEEALALASRPTGPEAANRIAGSIGSSVKAVESVPMAFSVVRLAGGDPWQAAVMSANVGDDTDTIGAISCGMAGACAGAAMLPTEKCDKVVAVNRLQLAPIISGLLQLREARA